MQVHLYYMGSSKSVPAELSKHFVEKDLMEKYQWTPQQINSISYIWLQKYYLLERAMRESIKTKQEYEEFKKEHNPSKKGVKSSKRVITKSLVPEKIRKNKI